MVKKIKFPLEMGQGIYVRTIEELNENFNIEKVLGYYVDGKLITWLNDRYYKNEAFKIEQLDAQAPDFISRLCERLEQIAV